MVGPKGLRLGPVEQGSIETLTSVSGGVRNEHSRFGLGSCACRGQICVVKINETVHYKHQVQPRGDAFLRDNTLHILYICHAKEPSPTKGNYMEHIVRTKGKLGQTLKD